MPDPSIPPELDSLTEKPFSFYPAILNIEHNEWQLSKSTWSEVLVVNRKTGLEVWIPRRFIGEVSCVDEPVMIVGLTKELEYQGGSVWPHERRVITMPRATSGAAPSSAGHGTVPPPKFSTRLDSAERRIGRLIGAVLLVCVVAGLLVVAYSKRSVRYRTIEESNLALTADDDYYSIVRKLGTPTGDRWRSDTGELQYRLLAYSGRPYVLILMGTDRQNAHYIGAMNKDWKPVHSVRLPNGDDTRAMLRKLGKW
ncbi:MAG: hypothetical protein ABFD89_11730 [Bryobacteraceae bacterium]